MKKCFLLALGIMLSVASRLSCAAPTAAHVAVPVRHVFVIVLENEPFDVTFGAQSLAPYLAHELTRQGALLTQYYGTGHYSLDNYISLISGQAPNPATQEDCSQYVEFKATTGKLDANGQLAGSGCVYPSQVKTVADQLRAARFSWKGYMEGMGSDPSRETAQCGHAAIGSRDHSNGESLKDRYADKHDPFVYFHSIIDDPAYCGAHVVPLNDMAKDLENVATTPNYAFITPDLCHDGHDAPCRNGEPGGLVSADAFLRTWVPRITASPAFRKDGVLIITFDEGTDGTACCGEQPLPRGSQPGQYGPGGGRIGAVVLSPFVKPGTISDHPYNHYSTLRSVEQWFSLPYLSYAQPASVPVFGNDVFNQRPGASTSR
ncbi:alkaline phosphatase family protein [Rhodanobacter sp. Si-c]|uniref:Alkaline phosphatase family protein n=1 Tax=Rhodanobacter lycopersici TaxID=3162487 RepID=A0ABV3Q9B8_9GAMM